MERALAETDRRRNKQIEFNTAYGVVPRGITKSITDIMQSGRSSAEKTREGKRLKVAEPRVDYRSLSPAAALKRIRKLEAQMQQHARNLEFEAAAVLRDEINVLRRVELGLPI